MHAHIFFGICTFVILIFGPDLFLPKLLLRLRKSLGDLDENLDWKNYSKILGWVERSLYAIFFVFLSPEFVVFVGIWLALKVIGGFNNWQPTYFPDSARVSSSFIATSNDRTRHEYHKRRANYMIFTIGTGISLLWVIVIGLIFLNYTR